MAFPSTRARVTLLAAGACVVAGLELFRLVRLRGSLQPTSYVWGSGVATVLSVTAGVGLVVAGLAQLTLVRATAKLGLLALLAGCLWFAPNVEGWVGGNPFVRSLAGIASGFLYPVVVHLVAASPGGLVRPRWARLLVAAVYGGIAVAAVSLALFRDPFFDPTCWANCTDNEFLVRSVPDLSHSVQVGEQWFIVCTAALFVAVVTWRSFTELSSTRVAFVAVAVPGIGFAVATAMRSAWRLVTPEYPSGTQYRTIFVMTSATLLALAVGVTFVAVLANRKRRSIARIVSNLGDVPPPGSVEAALATIVGDAELRIAYWLPDAARFVSADGSPAAQPQPGPDRAVTELVRDGSRVAVICHSAALPNIAPNLGSAIRLGLENERLQAEVLAHIGELRDSRARVVAAGDRERRRLERDLHDGAQQHLHALLSDLRLAAASAQQGGDSLTEGVMAEAMNEARSANEQLRELAHGIFPTILANRGLAPAVMSLSYTAPIPVETRRLSTERFAATIESAAYVAITEALRDAADRRASYAVIETCCDNGLLMITIDDDGDRNRTTPERAADRVNAMGGTVTIESNRMRMELPCA